MRRKLSLVIAFVGVLGLVGFAPAAQANHDGGAKNDGKHEAAPLPPVPDDVGAACVVRGDVIIGDSAGNGGVTANEQNHNHYKFGTVAINCNALQPAFNQFAGDYIVQAAGGTDGAVGVHGTTTAHGEDDLLGWSHQDGYEGTHACILKFDKDGTCHSDLYDGTSLVDTPNGCANCGEITVDGPVTSASTDNAVLFLREGINVQAWGILHSSGKPPLCFLAELEFRPEPKVGQKVNFAELDGTAQLWFGPKGSPGAIGTCAIDQGANKK